MCFFYLFFPSFLANVDPVDVFFAEHGFNPETTLVVIISKTFTTAETILNAHTVRQWFSDYYGGNEAAIRKLSSSFFPYKQMSSFSRCLVFLMW